MGGSHGKGIEAKVKKRKHQYRSESFDNDVFFDMKQSKQDGRRGKRHSTDKRE
jgi:hypothetical protein